MLKLLNKHQWNICKYCTLYLHVLFLKWYTTVMLLILIMASSWHLQLYGPSGNFFFFHEKMTHRWLRWVTHHNHIIHDLYLVLIKTILHTKQSITMKCLFCFKSPALDHKDYQMTDTHGIKLNIKYILYIYSYMFILLDMSAGLP